MQSPDAPVACTLAAGALQQRLAWIRRVTAQSLTAHRLDGATLHLTYRREAWPELEKIVAEEQQCCAFLRFSLRALRDGVELEIQAPGDAGHDVRWLFDHFLPAMEPSAAPKACGCAPGAGA